MRKYQKMYWIINIQVIPFPMSVKVLIFYWPNQLGTSFLHFIKTQCSDQMVTMSLLTDRLSSYNFLSSTASKTAKSSAASGSSSSVAPKEDDANKTQEEGERNEKLSTMSRSERESSMRKIVSKLLKESKCEKYNTKHKQSLWTMLLK